LREGRKRSCGSEEQTAALEFVVVLLKARLDGANGLIGEVPGVGANARDDAMSFSRRSFYRAVIGLPKFIREGFDEVRTLTQKHQRQSLLERYRDESGPA
jgi:hypothetical protein